MLNDQYRNQDDYHDREEQHKMIADNRDCLVKNPTETQVLDCVRHANPPRKECASASKLNNADAIPRRDYFYPVQSLIANLKLGGMASICTMKYAMIFLVIETSPGFGEERTTEQN